MWHQPRMGSHACSLMKSSCLELKALSFVSGVFHADSRFIIELFLAFMVRVLMSVRTIGVIIVAATGITVMPGYLVEHLALNVAAK